MSKEEAAAILVKLEEYVEETTSTKEKALAALVAAGIVKQDGKLHKAYQA